MPVHELQLTAVEAERVLLPDEHGNDVEGIRITVLGPGFPQRALQPELWVGDHRAEHVSIAPDGRSLRGYLRHALPDGAPVVVRYGSSQVGRLDEVFRRKHIRPLPEGCR